MLETPSLGDIRQELLEACGRGDLEGRERLRTLLAALRVILADSRVPFDQILRNDFPGEDGLPPSSSPDECRQLSLDFRDPSEIPPEFDDRMKEKKAEYPSSLVVAEDIPLKELCGLTRSRLEKHFRRADAITGPDLIKDYLIARLSPREREIFASIFLDNRHRVIAYEEMFSGTVDGCGVHPREVVKRSLFHNAAAIILAHNHPSGVPEASRADENITRKLKDALALVDVRVLDHILVGGGEAVSFAEKGIM